MADQNRNSFEQMQMLQLAQCILPETSKIFWIMQRIEFERSKLTHDHDLSSQIITIDTIMVFTRAIYQTQIDGKEAYDIIQMLDGLKIGMINKESFNHAIAIRLREEIGEAAFKMSFQLQSEVKALHIVIANIFMIGTHPLTNQLTEYLQKKQSLNVIIEFISKIHLQSRENRKRISDEIQLMMNTQCNLLLEDFGIQWTLNTKEESLQSLCKLLSYQHLTMHKKDMKNIGEYMNTLYQKMNDYNFFNQMITKLIDNDNADSTEYFYLIQILKLIFTSGRIESQQFNGEKFVNQFLETYQQQLFQQRFVKKIISNCQINDLEKEIQEQPPLNNDEVFLQTLEAQIKQKQFLRHEHIQYLSLLCKYHQKFRKYLTINTDLLQYYRQFSQLLDDFSICLVSYLILEISQQELIEQIQTVSYVSPSHLVQNFLYFGQYFASQNFANHAFSSEIIFNGIDIIYNSLLLVQHLPTDIDRIFDLLDNLMKSTNEDIQSRVLRIFKSVIDSTDEKLKLKFINQSRLEIIYFELQKSESGLRMQCLEIIKSLINQGMIIETLHSQLINTLIRNKYSDEENITIMKIFRNISQREQEFILIGMLENGLLEKISKVVLESFVNFKLDCLNDICIYENPYLSFEFFVDYISIVYQIALKNKNNKFEAFLKESFFKNLHSTFQHYFDNKLFCLMTINQRIEQTIHSKQVTHRFVYIILDLVTQFVTTFKNNIIIESQISRLSNNIPINVLIEVKYIEIIPIDLNTAIGDKFKVSKDVPYTDFMRFISLNFQGKYTYKIKNADDNQDIDDDHSLQKAIKKAMEIKIQSDEKMFTLRIRIFATPIQQQQVYVDYPQQQHSPYIIYGGQRSMYPVQMPQMQQPQSMIQNRYIVLCKICKGSFQSYGQIMAPCIICNSYVPNQYSYQAIPQGNLYATFGSQPQQPQIQPQMVIPIQAPSPQLQLAYSPINKSTQIKTSLSSPYKID